jgi:hypothetical protein
MTVNRKGFRDFPGDIPGQSGGHIFRSEFSISALLEHSGSVPANLIEISGIDRSF